MTPGAGTIPDGWNRNENHEALISRNGRTIPRAAAAKVPNVITFSGNRKGMPDDEGKENCVMGLSKVKKLAEDNGVTICWNCSTARWTTRTTVRPHRVGRRRDEGRGSPRVKLLYDIYHMQIMEGDIIRTIRENIPIHRATSTPAAFPAGTKWTTPRNCNGAPWPRRSPTSGSQASSPTNSYQRRIRLHL